ncbi:MAG: hypothetical protein B6D59_03110 [Campylobacteraceae bacterium 4484_4]|nr:MAG: hypothetical protein B6D59_03110 [Campylobacteraceae bacterium 4484_4]
MARTLPLLLLSLLLLGGCTCKLPNTWRTRLVSTTPHPPLFLKTIGSGNPILLIHGLGTDHHSFRKISPSLSKNHRLYLIDLKGFGNSPKPTDGRYSPYDHAAWILDTIRRENLRHLTIIAHSIGAAVAMIITLKAPDQIDRLILIDPVVYPQYYPKLLSYLRNSAFARAAFYLLPASWMIRDAYGYAFYDPDKIDSELIEIYAENLNRPHARYAFLKTLMSLQPEDMKQLAKRYRKITIPVLIISGEKDIVTDRQSLIRLDHTLPRSRHKTIPRCGHIPQEECPQITSRFIQDFLRKRER